MKISFIIGFVFLTISQFIFAQSGAVVLDFNHHQNNLLLGKLTQSATSVHTGFKPLVVQQLDSLSTDSVLYKASTDKLLPRSWYKTWFWRKLRYEDFATATTEKYNIRVNPLLRYEIGTEKVLNEKLLINTRGVKVDGSIGSKFAFSTSFYENQATYPQYIDTFAYQFGVIPGQGSPKLFGAQGHDFSRAEGYISFAPYKWLSLQLGQGRNFIGEGYRSMILSDNTFPYPYLRFNLGSGKWQLQALYTEFTDFLDKSKEGRVWHYSYHYKRHASMTYLSYKPTTKLELGLFEGIMWLTTDTAKNIYNKIPPSFFSPIPLLRILNYGLQEDQNVLLGLQGKYSPFRNLNIYGQFVLDNIGKLTTNQWAAQIGTRFWNKTFFPFMLQAELNHATPYTYSHNNPRSNWLQYNQPLAHPLGAAFTEFVFIAQAHVGDIWLDTKYITATFLGDQQGENFGQNIYLSQSTATTDTNLAPTNGTFTYLEINLAFMLNPRTNLQIFATLARREKNDGIILEKSDYFGFGLRSQIFNYYFDF